MERRDFIKLTAVTGTSATLAACGNPEHQLIRFVPDEELVPGVAEWKPSACPVCRAGCGVIVRVMEGDAEVVRDGQRGVVKMGLAKKLEGNPAHPVNQGALCARGQAAIQLTYHPDRIRNPLKRSGDRGSGHFREVTWDEALGELASRLDALAAAGDERALAFLVRAGNSQRHDLTARFVSEFGAPPPVPFELFGDEVLRRANLLSFGREQLPSFDLAQSRYVIGFGADFLGTWNSPVSQAAAYGWMRQGRSGIRGRFVQVEPRMSQTGANADEWVPVRPGTEGILALGLAHIILAARLRPSDAAGQAGRLIDGWSSGLSGYSPAEVERRTGVSAKRIDRLAREFADRRPAVAIIGGAPLAQTNGLFQALAVNALNALVGGVGEPGGLFFTPMGPGTPGSPGARTIAGLASEILASDRSPVEALLVDGANPVFATPAAWRVRDAVLKVPFVASFSSFLDETSMLADLILPDHTFLESWTDGRVESGASVATITLGPPTIRPLHQTRATPDVLLEVGRRLRQPPQLPWKTFEEMLHDSFSEEAWTEAKKQGYSSSQSSVANRQSSVASRQSSVVSRQSSVATEARFDGDASQFPFHLLPYASQAFLDGSVAHLPWLQELPDVITTAMWSSWVEINPQTAARLAITEGDIVEVGSRQGTLSAPALISPGIAPDVIAMPVGQGHTTFTRYASDRGENPVRLLAPLTEPETGALAWAATRVRVARIGDKDGRLVLFAGSKVEHPDLTR